MITVFKNGHVHTMEREHPIATAVAIEDDKIIYVGDDAGAAAYENGAKVVDLEGKMLIPGMVDAHCHPIDSPFLTSGLELDVKMGREEVLDAIREYVEENPEKECYFGFGYPEWEFEDPRKEMLDEVCPDKPLFLIGSSIHEAWCNSRTLEVLHIDRTIEDPIPGRSFFRRDENGELTGSIVEAAAQQIIVSQLPWFDDETVAENYHEIFDSYASKGVTGFVDGGSSGELEAKGVAFISDFERTGALKQRISSCVMVEDPIRFEVAVDLLKERFDAHHSDLYTVRTMKIINDGIIETGTASMYQPYPDGSFVQPFVSGEKLYAKCVEAAAAGFDIHIHGIGNKTIHETLMAAKAVREAGYFDNRITNAHTHIALHDDLRLFGKYNVIANTSSIWHYYTEDAAPCVGLERSLHQFELASVIRHGARMTLGSDFPADEIGNEPLKGIQMGVTRQMFDDPEARIMEPASERLSVEQCLEAYTINAAYAMHMEDRIGSIKVGKYADLVVLEKDITEIDPHDIFATPVLLTLLGGKPTYQNETFQF